ncbi:DUF6049 family protein [Microbacterium suwonense]|uniref:2-oxoglutarate dehydrogenase n=1 Tax=Microbacterium suwonense TaxID=683047 RepID=A0ABN6X5J1_9MICO|nr:DUF6049 family protein [Microbacterium suwonense]BDZ39967.1 hypothetical protein GCM10025863_25810 [Microbacterium suwonense]
MLVVGAIALGGASPASADDDVQEPDDAPAVTLGVSAGPSARIDPNGPLVTTITIVNGTDHTLSVGSASLEVNTTPLADAATLDAWLDTGAFSGTFRTVATEETPAVAAGESVEVSSIADATELGTLAPGVYPITARLTGATTDDADTTAWTPTASSVLVVAAAGQQQVGVLVPITATPADGALLSADELATLTAPDGMLTGQLDAVTDTSAILAIDPAIPAAIRMLGTRAPRAATDWLQRLEQLPNDMIILQFADADATTQAHEGQESLLQPPDLTPLLQPDDFPQSGATPTPSASSAPDPALPDNAVLTGVAGARTDILWPRDDVTAADLAAFTGYLGDDATTILPSTSFSGATRAHSAVEGNSILVMDAAASDRLSTAVELTEPVDVARALAGAAGHLFFATHSAPTVLVGLTRSETRSPVALRELLSAFATPGISLSSLRAQAPASAALIDPVGSTRPAALTTMLAGEQRMQAFSSILEVPALLMAPERIRMLRTIAVGMTDEDFTAAAAARAKHVHTILNSVGIQRPKPVQLITSAAPLPVWVRNDLPWTVHVTLHGLPSDPRLDIQRSTQVEAGADGSTRIDVPIEARVASGDVRVQFRLTSATGVAIGSTEVADVTLRADWEGIGLGILGGAIALLLVFGLIRTVRRKRRDGAGASTKESE